MECHAALPDPGYCVCKVIMCAHKFLRCVFVSTEDNSAKLADSAGEFEAMCKKLAQQQGKRGWFG